MSPIQSPELQKACKSLRVGDVLKIKLEREELPFEATLTQVIDRSTNYTYNGGDIYYQHAPLICWSKDDGDCCDAGWVVEIISKASYKVNYNQVRNSVYRAERRVPTFRKGYHYDETLVSPGLYRVTGIPGFARQILSKYPSLDIPYGINLSKVFDEWQKAGYPGLKGGYAWKTSSVVPHFPHDLWEGRESLNLSEIVEYIIHYRSFKKWVLRNYMRFTLSKKEAQECGREEARHLYEIMIGDDYV